ncbi:MAG: DUF4815 domain-containing protein [Armatimonadota bacterium]
MSDSTFDVAKNYKKICYRADRDLLNTELNEAQDIALHERDALFDKILSPGTILSGLAGTVSGSDVTITGGVVYLDGCAVNIPGATLSFPASGDYIIYVDVFRREVTASEDASLVNPLTGEPTAEREKWIASLQTRDTSGDPLPEGALSRTVVPVYFFDADTGELRPCVGVPTQGGDILSILANHIGHGGIDRHPAVSSESAGFMTPEQLTDLESKAENTDLTALSGALNTHKTSADHDGRYFTETESNANFAPKSHVGSGGTAHSNATTSTAGFMAAADKTQLGDHETRVDAIEAALPGKADDADVTAVSNALNTHKSSSDHDGRYYTETESNANFAPNSHVGTGGTAHSAATISQAGFMAAADKTQLGDHETRIVAVETELPEKATEVELQVVATAFTWHRTSNDHDGEYYPKAESDARFTPIAHVGATGSAHGLATASADGFIAKELCGFLKDQIKWDGGYDYGNDYANVLEYGVMSSGNGMIWRGKCDADSTHTLATQLRATSYTITALFEFYHMTGTVTMETGDRVTLGDPGTYPPRVPGGKVYLVQIYTGSFTNAIIHVTGSGDIGFSLNIFPGDDRQICRAFDPGSEGMQSYT